MKDSRSILLQSLGIPFLLVTLALMATCLLSQILPFTPHIVFVGAISLSALLGGIKAGLVSLLGSVLSINYFYIAPLYALTPGLDDLYRMVLFGFALVVIWFQQKYLPESLKRSSDKKDS